MSAHRFQSTWRSLIFNRRFDDSGVVDDPAHLVDAYKESDYQLNRLDISRVSEQDYRELRQFLEGAEPNEAFEGMRLINGEGVILASSVADLEDKTWAMDEAFSIAACRMAFATNDPPGVDAFKFKRATATAPGYLALQFLCRPGMGRPLILTRRGEGKSRAFSFQLIAFDPFAYGQTLHSVACAVGATAVTNAGNIYTKPQFVFAGAGAATITNSTTGQAFSLTSPAGGCTLDVARGTIVKTTGGAYGYDARVSGFLSQMFLVPGANSIVMAGIGCTVKFRDAYA